MQWPRESDALAEMKFHRPIVAIVRARGATEIYSEDEDIAAFGDAGSRVDRRAAAAAASEHKDLPLDSM